MSRYIDAEAFLKEYCEPYPHVYMAMSKALADAPSIDIVRCKECKHEPICNHSVQHTTHDAHSVTIGSKTVEWCSYGEREDE